jgi:DNA/RNA-binding domain of Phe-tRNA-synthetase-like protein
MKFTIDQQLKKNGLKVAMVKIANAAIVNKKKELEQEKKKFIDSVDWQKIESSPILKGYKKLYSDSNLNPPALNLLKLVKKNGRFPNINTVVDTYNLISAKTLFSIGAHDLSNIKGEVKFIVTTGNEKYTPLGSENNVTVNPDEYAAVDEEKIICLLDQKQCQETKITKDTKEFIVYVQGNDTTSQEDVNNVLGEVIETIKRFCVGDFIIIQEELETINSASVMH